MIFINHHTSFYFGAHIPFQGNMLDTLKSSIDYGMNCIQIFCGNPKGYKRSRISKKDLDKSLKLVENYPTKVFSHLPYLYNLCGSKNCLAYSGDKSIDDKVELCIEEIEYETELMSYFDGGCVLHVGNYIDEKIGLDCVAKCINKINFKDGALLLLENSAGQGTSLGTTINQLKIIYEKIDEKNKKNVGFCIDTCHLYAMGDYDISKLSEMKIFLDDFEKELGIENLKLVHLNDSKEKLKSRKDRHELIGEGCIWSENTDSLVYLLNYCKKKGIPLVLETHFLDFYSVVNTYYKN